MPPSPDELRALYDDYTTRRLPEWDGWRKTYLAYVERIANATPEQWHTPAFQEWLWEDEGVTPVGAGRAVVLAPEAYRNRALAELLWKLRGLASDLPRDTMKRALLLQESYDEVIRNVHPTYNPKRPLAKLLRMFAGLFPNDVTSIVSGHTTYLLRRFLGLRKEGLPPVGNQVRIRHVVATALGAPTSREEALRHSMFCWFLVEEKAEQDTAVAPEPAGAEPTNAPGLKLLPFKLQRKGLPMAGHLDLHLVMLRAVEGGASKEELLTAVREEWYESAATSTVNVQLSIAKAALGLIHVKDGALRPTPRGEALLEGEEPADVLAPIVIARVFGFAQLLRELERGGPMHKNEVYRRVRAWYPAWKNNIQPRSACRWATELGLIESSDDGNYDLTDAGRSWESGLPQDLEPWRQPAADARPTADSGDEGDPPAAVIESDDDDEPNNSVFQQVAFDDLAAKLRNNAGHLVLEEGFLATLHAALHGLAHKRFVLLTGLSGTGKSAIARAYAQAYCAALGLDRRKHFELIAVRPDWTDPSGILGYPNPLVSPPEFAKTPALELILAAHEDRGNPYFLCLDEMNLARVEHYFAPFLSAMEDPNADLRIHSESDSISGVPDRVKWPANLFVIGTVNMDETTHAFSDKVLDRAFSFELWDVDLPRWQEQAQLRHDPALVAAIADPLAEIHEVLRPARRHFGYRTCDEILAFVAAAPDGVALDKALDAAVLAKVLPKVRGDDAGQLPAALEKLEAVLDKRGLQRSKHKVAHLRESLATLGIARYFA